MTIYIATDHAGFAKKEMLVPFLRDELGFEVSDMGAYTLDPDDDYTDFVGPAARAVSAHPDPDLARGIVMGKSGQGEAMLANRFPRVRAAVFYGPPFEEVTLSREHNNANVLSIGAAFVSEETLKQAVGMWLETAFSGEARHKRRIQKLDEMGA